MEWAREIRRFRQLNGLKQFALADVLNVDQATVSRWERGVQIPDIATQMRLRTLIQQGMPLHDRLIRHLVRHAPGLAGLLDREARILEASDPAIALLGVSLDGPSPPSARPHFSDGLAMAWQEAERAGLFDGQVASVRVVTAVRDTARKEHRLRMLWQPIRLFDGTVLLRTDAHLLPATTGATLPLESFAVTRLEELDACSDRPSETPAPVSAEAV